MPKNNYIKKCKHYLRTQQGLESFPDELLSAAAERKCVFLICGHHH